MNKRIDELTKKSECEQTKAENYLNVAGVMLMVLDAQGNINSINKKGCEILEADKEYLIGKNWFDNFLPEKNIEKIKTFFEKVISGNYKALTDYENEIRTFKGNRKVMKWHSTVLQNDNKEIIEVLSSGDDITKYKANEIALVESNLRLQTLFEKAPLGYQSLDINGNIR